MLGHRHSKAVYISIPLGTICLLSVIDYLRKLATHSVAEKPEAAKRELSKLYRKAAGGKEKR